MSEHTPGDWGINQQRLEATSAFVIESNDGHGNIWTVAEVIGIGERGGETEANAEFIVRACNSHEELLEAAKAIVGLSAAVEHDPPIEILILERAIEKAEGRE